MSGTACNRAAAHCSRIGARTERFISANAIVGASPGIEHDEIVRLPDGEAPVRVTCIDYGPGQALQRVVEDIDSFLACHRPEWSSVRWINVDGLSDMGVIHGLATKYELHPLAVEDLLHLRQRPKVEA